MNNLTDLTLGKARKLLGKKEISSVELTQSYLDRMEKYSHLNAYSIPTPELALEAAQASDFKRRNNPAGILEGIPLGVKDLFCTLNVETTSCSKILTGFIPPYESTVSGKLKEEGGIMLGKTNMDELAMGSANETSSYGPVINPWVSTEDESPRVPGGSSGGSAAAVSARLCLGALGSDTGGSVRQPASFCGIVGLKPTYGRCSRLGMIAYASSLDQAGVMTLNVEDAAIMLEAIAGYDPKDSMSVNLPVPSYEKALNGNIQGMRIGIPKEYNVEGMSDIVKSYLEKGKEWLKEEGAEIIDISLPHTPYALPVYYIIATAEASSNLSRFDGVRYGLRVSDINDSLEEMYKKTRSAGFGWEVKRRIMMGTYVLSSGFYEAYYRKAQYVRSMIAQDFKQNFEQVDAILAPTTPTTAFPLGQPVKDPVTMYLNDVFTVTVNLVGLPAISVPVGLSQDGLPLGLQLIGKPFEEGSLLNIAYTLEKAAQFTHLPSLLHTR